MSNVPTPSRPAAGDTRGGDSGSGNNPVLLIKHDLEKFEVTEEGAAYLRSLGSAKLKVVSILGVYRSGKSYLLNRLMQRPKGAEEFDLGHETVGKTQGIWAWGADEAGRDSSRTLYLDVEGVSDPDGENKSNATDGKIALLVALLSSCFMINIKNVPSSIDLQRLAAVSAMVKRLEAGGLDEKSLRNFLPPAWFVIRDKHLDWAIKKDDGSTEACSSDQYLDWLFTRSKSSSVEQAEVKKALASAFPHERRAIYSMPLPVPLDQLKYLAHLEDSEINEEFLNTVEDIKRDVERKIKAKTLYKGAMTGAEEDANKFIAPDGPGLATIAQSLVTQINSSENLDLPSLLDAYEDSVATAAIADAEEAYRKVMDVVVPNFPLESSELIDQHLGALKEATKPLNAAGLLAESRELLALNFFVRIAGSDEGVLGPFADHFEKPEVETKGLFHGYVSTNIDASRSHCEAVRLEVSRQIGDKLTAVNDKDGAKPAFSDVANYDAAFAAVKDEYNARAKGPAKEEVFKQLLESDRDWTKLVLSQIKADVAEQKRAKAEQEKRVAEEKHKADMEAKEKELASQKQLADANAAEATRARQEADAANTRAQQAMQDAQQQMMNGGGYGGDSGRGGGGDGGRGGGRGGTWVRPHTRRLAGGGTTRVRGHWRGRR